MSVSHGWRSTILSFPSLWSVVHLDGGLPSEAIRVLLEISKEHPLDVVIPYAGCASKSVRYSHALDASAHIPRIRKFFFYPDMRGTDMKRIARIFSKPAPNLIHLELDAAQQLGRTTPFPNIFALEFPKLRVLKVAAIEGWPEIVGANLTRITINKILKPQVLKDCLSYSPNLKVLEVQGLWTVNRGIFSTSEKIALPPGVRLSIQRTRECPRILTFFALPRDGHVRISPFIISKPDRPLLSYVLPANIFHLQNLHTITRLHAKARYDLDVIVELEGFRLDRPVFDVNVRYFFENRTALVSYAISVRTTI